MTVIACSKCGLIKALSEFHRYAAHPAGRRPDCKACRSEVSRRWSAANPGARNAEIRAWAKANPDRVASARKRHNDANREKRRATSREWQRTNRAYDAERSAFQRAAQKQATPAWADRSVIRDVYALCRIANDCTPYTWHVDHIIPLAGKQACGLHVPSNLTVIFAELNVAKGNRIGGGLSL
jgi:hypothetical protein